MLLLSSSLIFWPSLKQSQNRMIRLFYFIVNFEIFDVNCYIIDLSTTFRWFDDVSMTEKFIKLMNDEFMVSGKKKSWRERFLNN